MATTADIRGDFSFTNFSKPEQEGIVLILPVIWGCVNRSDGKESQSFKGDFVLIRLNYFPVDIASVQRLP